MSQDYRSTIGSPRVSLYSALSPKGSRKERGRDTRRVINLPGEVLTMSLKVSVERKRSTNHNTKKEFRIHKEPIKRIDAYGNLIQKGGKVHKLSFADTLGKKELVQFVNIQSCKDSSETKLNKKKGNADCCSVF